MPCRTYPPYGDENGARAYYLRFENVDIADPQVLRNVISEMDDLFKARGVRSEHLPIINEDSTMDELTQAACARCDVFKYDALKDYLTPMSFSWYRAHLSIDSDIREGNVKLVDEWYTQCHKPAVE